MDNPELIPTLSAQATIEDAMRAQLCQILDQGVCTIVQQFQQALQGLPSKVRL